MRCRIVVLSVPIKSAGKNNKPLPFSQFSRSRHTFRESIYANNRIITNLISDGSLGSAIKMFDEMQERDVITWNIMISGLQSFGLCSESLLLYRRMVSLGVLESSTSLSTVLSVCSDAGFYREGLVVHCRVIVLGWTTNVFIGSALVDLYLQMGFVDVALQLFDDLPERNLASWNVLLRGVCDAERFKDTLGLYIEMKLDNLEPNGLTFCYLIRGCVYSRFLDEGMQLHCLVIKNGIVNSNLFVANSLVDFYSACGSFTDAKKSFETVPPEDVISWNSMVSVCAVSGHCLNALKLFREMHFWGKKPSSSSFLGFLKLSSSTKNIILGKQIHSSVLKLSLDGVLIQSALIDMYGKCGDVESSFRVFDYVSERNLECCNSLMSSLLAAGLIEDVVELFCLMVDEKIEYDEVSLSTALKALSSSAFASAASCDSLHCCSIKSGFESYTAVTCSLIDLYSRLGGVNTSLKIFEQVVYPNVVCFTSVMSSLVRNGLGKECVLMFDAMIRGGLKPDKVAFLSVLTGCAHSGLLEEGRCLFHAMEADHGLNPERQHYSCMVDLLGRAGLVSEAEQLLEDTPWQYDGVIWSSILRSCTIHRIEGLGKKAAKILTEVEPENPASWLQASRFYSETGDFETSEHLRQVAVARKVRAEIGQSFIEVVDHPG